MRRRKNKTRVEKITPAGHNHQVVTVAGGDGNYCAKPCAECPWRKSNAGSFPAEAFKISANTAYDMAQKTFGCHMAGKIKPAICAGFLLHGSVHNLSVRIKLSTGDIDLDKVADGGADLFENYRAMAEANGVSPDDPALAKCRSAKE